MANIFESLSGLIGRTPLYRLPDTGDATVLLKLEGFNPAGSHKDRAALFMLETARKQGLLGPDSVIIEPTSGNTGIALCALAAAWGLKCIIVMPDTMSPERQQLMAAYGAQVVLSPGSQGMAGAIALAEDLAARTPNSWMPRQFENPANALSHQQTTGPEIWADTDGKVDIFIAGVGTGGAVTGVGRYLKGKNPNIQILAVEPTGSPVLSGGAPGKHGIQGIGAGFVPKLLDTAVIDRVISVSDGNAMAAARNLARTQGLLVGISSGAVLAAARLAAAEPQNRGKTVVALLPDCGERYLSTSLFA